MIGAASHLTPTQQEIADKRRAFRAKVAARAVPDPGIDLTRPSMGERGKPDTPPIKTQRWHEAIERWSRIQGSLPQTVRQTWFFVAEDITLKRNPTICEIQIATAKHYNVTRMDILSARRTANVVRPRQVAMYLCRTMTLHSLPQIGRQFGGRDHTTALHAFNKIARLIEENAPNIASDIESLRKSLEAA